jgi:hypothetical protein
MDGRPAIGLYDGSTDGRADVGAVVSTMEYVQSMESCSSINNN